MKTRFKNRFVLPALFVMLAACGGLKAQLACPFPITNASPCDAVISYTLYYTDLTGRCVPCTSASGVVLSCCAPGGSNSTINISCTCGNLCDIDIRIDALPSPLGPPAPTFSYPEPGVSIGACGAKIKIGTSGATIF